MKSVTIGELLTPAQLKKVKKIVEENDQPHKEIVAYLNSQPAILPKWEEIGILVEYGAYAIEHALTR